MKVYSISDFHLSIDKPKPMNVFGSVWDNYRQEIVNNCKVIDNDDLLLVAGDISWAMNIDEAIPDLRYISALPGKKVLTRGNHDYWWKGIGSVRAVLPKGVYAIQNDAVKFDNVVICGSRGWTTPEPNAIEEAEDKKIYARELLRMEMSLTCAKKLCVDGDKIIAMIHYPPFNSKFDDSRFTELFDKFNVSAVVYGHLHGKSVRSETVVLKNGIKYYLTSCDIIKNNPVQVDITEA